MPAIILCAIASVPLGCAGYVPEHAVTHRLPGGLVSHVETAGTGDASGPESTLIVEISVAGRTIGPIASLTNRNRRLVLSDPNLIDGLRLGLPGIRVGETRRIEIPWRLAYGETGRPPIPPKEDLVCSVVCTEIIRIGGEP